MNPAKFGRNPIVRIAGIYALWILIGQVSYSVIAWRQATLLSVLPSPAYTFPLLIETVQFASCCIAIAIALRLAGAPFLISLGLTRKGAINETVIGCLIGVGQTGIFVAVASAGGWYHITGIDPHYHWAYTLLFTLVGVITEEFFFRGYVLPTIERSWGTGLAIGLSCLLFGAGHVIVWNFDYTPELVVRPLLTGLVLGLLMSSAYLLTRRLWMSIGLHWAWNFAGTVFFFNQSTGLWPFFFARITSKAYGIEGAVYWTFIVSSLVLTFLLMRRAIREGQWRSSKLKK